MAIRTIAHKPDLTGEQAQEIFRRYFEGRYKVEGWKGPSVGAPRDFLVYKSPFVGVSVKLQQGEGTTKFVYTGLAPKLWARVLLSLGLVILVAGMLLWNGLVNEVRALIESAPEFK